MSATIAAAVEEDGAANQEIARSVQRAAAGTAEVSSNVSGISQAATDTGCVATRLNVASQRIGKEVGTLRSEVEKFGTAGLELTLSMTREE